MSVNHQEGRGCGGTLMLQQGIQRRIRITLIYEAGSEIHWLRVNELVIGRDVWPVRVVGRVRVCGTCEGV